VKASKSSDDGTVQKAIRIIDNLVEASDGLGLSDVARATNLNKATAYRILTILKGAGFVRQNDSSRRYSLGLRLVQLGAQVLDGIGIPRLARPHMTALMRETKQTVHLGILEDSAVVYIAKIEGSEGVTLRTRVGSTPPIHVTAIGKCLIAFLSAAEREELLNRIQLDHFTKNTITNQNKFRHHLDEIRRLGYAVDNEEHRGGIRCVAAPIFDSRNMVVAAVGVAGPIFHITEGAIPHIAQLVIRCAEATSVEMGQIRKREALDA
jgi:IclR family transcriptional regulator, KDG regulon repressor